MCSVQSLIPVLIFTWLTAAGEPFTPPPRQAPQTEGVATAITVLPPARSQATSDEDVFTAVRRSLPQVRYESVPLARVLDDLCMKLGTNVVVEPQPLADAGIDMQTPISLDLRSLPAEYVVQLALEEAAPEGPRLKAVIDGGVLRISTAESLNTLVTQVHDIRELLASAPGQVPISPDVRAALQKQLVRAIECSVAPDSWDVAGGRGTIGPFGDNLLVSSTLTNQREITALVDALVKTRRGGAMWIAPGWDQEADADSPVWAALRRVIPRVSYRDVTLAQVTEDLRRALGINVHVYANALARDGGDSGRTATLDLQNVTAERMLREVLDQVANQARASWEVRNGVLLIGPFAYLQREMLTRVYDMGDLGSSNEPCERLTRYIKSMVAPDSWVDAGGRGSSTFFRGRAVVYNAPAVHREIELLLTELRSRTTLPH